MSGLDAQTSYGWNAKMGEEKIRSTQKKAQILVRNLGTSYYKAEIKTNYASDLYRL